MEKQSRCFSAHTKQAQSWNEYFLECLMSHSGNVPPGFLQSSRNSTPFTPVLTIHLSFVLPLVRAFKTRGGQDCLLSVAACLRLQFPYLDFSFWLVVADPDCSQALSFVHFSPLLLALLPTPKSILKWDPIDTDVEQLVLLLLVGWVERFFNLNQVLIRPFQGEALWYCFH